MAVEFAFTVIKPRVLKHHAILVAATEDGVFHVGFQPCGLSPARLHAELDSLLGLAATSAASSGRGRSSGGAAKCRVLVAKAAREITAYLKGKLRDFSVPLDMEVLGGRSAFDRKVWGALRRVSHGSVTTYGNLAAGIDRPGAARAVGSAVGRNPVAILIPCHRVVGTGGRLTGFSAGLAIKEVLLGIEGFRLSSARKREDRRVLTAGPSGARGPAARRVPALPRLPPGRAGRPPSPRRRAPGTARFSEHAGSVAVAAPS